MSGEGLLIWRDVILATHEFIHHGGLGDRPAGVQCVQIQPGNKSGGTACGTYVVPQYAVCRASLCLLQESLTSTVGDDLTRWQRTPCWAELCPL